MTEKEKTILNFMEKLKISREEAEELYLDDLEDNITEEGEELNAKAKNVKNVVSGNKRKKSDKPRKIDNEKLEILKELAITLEKMGLEPTIEKEVAIHFGEYSLKLTRHRPKKS